MKRLYLILAATAVLVTCEPQRSNNDIIWYPVDGEDGVFISTIGEKHRTAPSPKWRSRRLPRFSGVEVPYDPTENHDPSFFHNIHDRRPHVSNTPIPKIPPSIQYQQYPAKRPSKSIQAQGNQIPNGNNVQEILIEVYDFTKYPSANEYSLNRPNNQWNRPAVQNQNQWGGNPFLGNNNHWNGGQGPVPSNQWGSSGNLVSQYPGQRPVPSNQWGGTSGNFVNQRPGQRPAASNQWGGSSGNLVNGQRPVQSNQWGSSSGNLVNQYPGQRPGTSSQWGGSSGNLGNGQRPVQSNQWGGSSGNIISQFPEQGPDTNQWGSNSGSRPFERPTDSEWVASPDNINRPNNNRPNSANGPTDQSDKLIFPGDTSEPTTPSNMISTDLGPTDPPTMSPCELKCPVTPEFNPVCGSDSTTYSNAGRLKCAQMCGKDVRLSHYGSCGRPPFITPLVSNNPRQKFLEFW